VVCGTIDFGKRRRKYPQIRGFTGFLTPRNPSDTGRGRPDRVTSNFEGLEIPEFQKSRILAS
jgi:hypothetical protein